MFGTLWTGEFLGHSTGHLSSAPTCAVCAEEEVWEEIDGVESERQRETFTSRAPEQTPGNSIHQLFVFPPSPVPFFSIFFSSKALGLSLSVGVNKIRTFGCKICYTEGNNVKGKQDRGHVFLGRYLTIYQSKGARSTPKVRVAIKIILLPKTPGGASAEAHPLLLWLWLWWKRGGTGGGCAFTGGRVLAAG